MTHGEVMARLRAEAKHADDTVLVTPDLTIVALDAVDLGDLLWLGPGAVGVSTREYRAAVRGEPMRFNGYG